MHRERIWALLSESFDTQTKWVGERCGKRVFFCDIISIYRHIYLSTSVPCIPSPLFFSFSMCVSTPSILHPRRVHYCQSPLPFTNPWSLALGWFHPLTLYISDSELVIINGRQASTFIPIDFSYPSTNISVSYGPCSEFLEYSLELTLRTADCTPFVCVSLSFGMLRSSSEMDYRVPDTSCVVLL